MSKYTTLLFDADATLMDFHRSEREAVKECLEFFGLPSDDSVINRYSEINAGYWKMLERGEIEKDKLYPARWQSLIDYYGFDCKASNISDKYIERLATKSYMLEGALDLCKRLHGKFKMYIVTNGQKDIQRSRLFPSPIFRYFDGCFISEDIGYEKPSVRFFESVIKEIQGYNPEKALIIGDSLTSDMEGGISNGLKTCYYDRSGKGAKDKKVDYVVTNLEEIKNIL